MIIIHIYGGGRDPSRNVRRRIRIHSFIPANSVREQDRITTPSDSGIALASLQSWPTLPIGKTGQNTHFVGSTAYSETSVTSHMICHILCDRFSSSFEGRGIRRETLSGDAGKVMSGRNWSRLPARAVTFAVTISRLLSFPAAVSNSCAPG